MKKKGRRRRKARKCGRRKERRRRNEKEWREKMTRRVVVSPILNTVSVVTIVFGEHVAWRQGVPYP